MHIKCTFYIILRILRKFIFNNFLLKPILPFIPYYAKNIGEQNPNIRVNKYLNYLKTNNYSIKDKVIIEIGIGTTNSTAYALVKNGARFVFAYEPYAHFNHKLDLKLLENISCNNITLAKKFMSKVKRIKNLKDIQNTPIDLALSSSVLEHVKDLETLFKELMTKLTKNAIMLHEVDYKDHFFKYPFHFLTFSKTIWDTLLNPGDLYRARFNDHIKLFDRLNLNTKVIHKQKDNFEFSKIKNFISSDFDKNDSDLNVCIATFLISQDK